MYDDSVGIVSRSVVLILEKSKVVCLEPLHARRSLDDWHTNRTSQFRVLDRLNGQSFANELTHKDTYGAHTHTQQQHTEANVRTLLEGIIYSIQECIVFFLSLHFAAFKHTLALCECIAQQKTRASWAFCCEFFVYWQFVCAVAAVLRMLRLSGTIKR